MGAVLRNVPLRRKGGLRLSVFMLLIISLVVYFRLGRKKDAWGWIVLYWAVLCAKNFLEAIENG